MKLQPPELPNVQCEVCHGYATERLNDAKPIPTLKPARALCVKRHAPYHAPDFQKNAKMDPIKHQGCERTLFISATCAGTFSSWMPIMFRG
jgi:hypothetical protein